MKKFRSTDSFVDTAAMDTYTIITGKKTLFEVYDSNRNFIALLFDPFEHPIDAFEIIDDLIEYFEETEKYEYCSELIKLKESIGDADAWIDKLLWSE
jgi:hypothetical protein